MIAPTPSPRFRRTPAAFTLVEVVLAVGIVAVGLLAVAALLRPALDSGRGVALRDGAVRASGAAEALLRERSFDEVYRWVQDGTPVFAFSLERGSPPTHFTSALPPTGDDLADLHAAIGSDASGGVGTIDGSLYQIELAVSEENPVPLSEIEGSYADPDDYPHAALIMELRFFPSIGGSGFENRETLPHREVYRYLFAKRR